MLISRFIILFGWTSAISAATIPSAKTVTQNNFELLSINATAVGNIDPRFSLTYQSDNPLLSTTPCLMNAVFAMQQLSLGNFTDHTGPRTYALPDYPTVSVVTEGTITSDTIERRTSFLSSYFPLGNCSEPQENFWDYLLLLHSANKSRDSFYVSESQY